MTVRRPPHTLKAAIARAAAPLGGVSSASLQIGGHEALLSHVSNPNRPDMLRLDHAIELDRLCKQAGGGTPILDFYQFAAGECPVPDDGYHRHMADLARESGDAIAAMAQALADGEIPDRNVDDMLREMAELQAKVGAIVGQLIQESRKRRGEAS